MIGILLSALVSITGLTPIAVAADTIFNDQFPFITGVTLTDLDNGKVLGDDTVTNLPKNANVLITYKFDVPNGKTIPTGTQYSITIPKEISLFGKVDPQPISDQSGNILGYLEFTADGAGTLTFTDYTSTHSNVGGTFSINGYFNAGQIGNTSPVVIPFEVQGTAVPYTVNVYFDQPDATNSKIVSAYDAAKGIVTWKVLLNTNDTTIKNGVFSDAITPGHTTTNDKSQTYVDGSFQVLAPDNSVFYNSSDGSGSGAFAYTATLSTDTAKTGTLQYTFPGTFSGQYTVIYQTKITDPSQYFGKAISNIATFTHDGITQSPAASYTIPVPNYITKTSSYDATNKQIDWTISFNNENLSLTNVVITDALKNGLTLDTGSVYLDADPAVPGSGTHLTVTAGGPLTYDTTGTYPTLRYAAGNIGSKHTLTFATNLPAGFWQQNHNGGDFSNAALMTADDNAYLKTGATGSKSGVGPSNTVISKSSLGYDRDAHTITWSVTVNGGLQGLPNASIKDTIPAGQQYAGSFTITPSAPVNGMPGTGTQAPLVTAPADPKTAATTLEYAFGAIPAGVSYTLTYKTLVLDSGVWAGNSNVSYKNNVVLTPGNSISTSPASASQTVNPTVLDKAANSYNYVTHEIFWKITVNQSQVPLTGVVVTDPLTGNGMDDFDLETGSILVNGQPYTLSATPNPAANSYYYDSTLKKLTFNLGDLNDATAANRQKVITFTTKLNKTGADYNTYFSTNSDKTISNTASLTSTENPTPVTKTGTQVIKNTLLGKTGYYVSGKAYIDWAVEINQNGITLNDLQLNDTLQAGLQLDTSSVKLYPQQLNANGTFTPALVVDNANATISVNGTAATLTGDNITYDATTRTFKFKMPVASFAQPYLLVFRTTVDPAYSSGSKFSNTISFDGTSTTTSNTNGNIPIGFSKIDSAAWGTTADVNISKVDSETGAGLAGAIFNLYDGYGNLVRVSAASDNTGAALFDHLRLQVPFKVTEATPPANYELSNDSFSFMLDASGKLQLLDASGNPTGASPSSLVFHDTRKRATISFIKTGDGGLPLAGATFQLCDTSNKPVAGFGTVTTDASGKVTFANVPYGSYHIVETSAPVGYFAMNIPVVLDDTNASIVTSGTTHTLDLGQRQDAASGSITVFKTGAAYVGAAASPLAGTVFAVVNKATGSQVGGTQTTGADGKVYFGSLPVGNYTLHEVSAPADYATVADYDFSIAANSTAATRQLTYNVTDYKKTGSISFTKTDGVNPLPGAEFTLYDSTGTTPVSNASGVLRSTSGANGLVQFLNVPYGDYIIKETNAPKNYDIMSPVPVSLHNASGSSVNLGQIADRLLTGSISFVKTNGSAALAGAQFTLTGNGITRQATSDLSGVVQFLNVPFSTTPYTISETQTPAPYYRKAADFTVLLNSDTANASRTVTLSQPVVDTPLGSITLTKTGSDTTSPLAGAVFELYDAGGNLVATSAATGIGGQVVFDNLALSPTAPTVYTVHEKTAPSNYNTAPDLRVTLYNFDNLRDATGLVFIDTRKLGEIWLNKADQNGSPLAGAEFTLYDAAGQNPVLLNGQQVKATSDTSGLVHFTNIPYGVYTVKETLAPADYIAFPVPVVANLTDGNPLVLANSLMAGPPVVNQIKTADLTLTKKTDGGALLPGATFTLYDKDGQNPVEVNGSNLTATSDASGVAVFHSVPYGDYTIVETGTPSDYLPAAPIPISVHDSNTALTGGVLNIGDVVDVLRLGSITFTKVDENNKPLPGAEFTLYDAAGHQVGSPQVSDEDGNVLFQNVPYGDGYTIKETAAPADYALLKDPVGSINLHAPKATLLSVSNSRLLGSITLKKLDENGNALKGAEFTLYDAAGKQVGQPQTSDDNGIVTFTNVPYNDGYSVKETKAPADYTVLEQPVTNIGLHQPSLTLSDITDTRMTGSIRFLKVDENNNPLPGAEFTLYDADGNQVGNPQVSDQNGVVLFQGVPYKDGYTIRETKAPMDYATIESPLMGVNLHDSTLTLANVADVRLTGSISFTKVDENNNPLPGTEFTLYDAGGNQVGSPQVSNAQGVVTFPGVPYHDGYVIKETKAPADYATAAPVTNIGLHQPSLTLANISDQRLTGSVSFTKVDENGSALPGAEFTLYDADGRRVGTPQVSDQNGVVTFNAVPYKDGYTIKETKAPADYRLLDEPITDVKLHAPSVTLDQVENTRMTGAVTFTKVDEKGRPLAGAEFTLFDAAGRQVGSPQVSGQDGVVTFSNVPYKDGYVIKETKAPADYAAITAPMTNVNLHQPTLTLSDVNNTRLTGSIQFSKLDENGHPLAGAEFTLYDADGNQVGVPQVSDASGIVVFANIPYGDGYVIKETKAPADYAALLEPITGINLHAASILLADVSDTRLTGTISFTKVDENGNALPGSEFTLYDANGSRVGTPQVSDANGIVSFKDVPFGNGYVVKETKAPANYAVCDSFTVSLHTEIYNYGKVADALLRGNITVKKTDAAGNPLDGAVFQLYDEKGNPIAKAVSDKTGTAVFENIAYGSYQVRETEAPSGYSRDDSMHAIVLNAENVAPVLRLVNNRLPSSNPNTGDGSLPWAMLSVLLMVAGGIMTFGAAPLHRVRGTSNKARRFSK